MRVTKVGCTHPEVLYQRLCDYQRQPVDRCMLYVFRCAVYYASSDRHEPDLLKWWNWKDKASGICQRFR